jgi:hypothetical protein
MTATIIARRQQRECPSLKLLFRTRPCPVCRMRMIVVDGFGEEPEQKTFECLQCGHIEKPEALDQKRRK